MIGIIGALTIEVKSIVDMMKNCEEETISKVKFYRGDLFGADIVVAISGVGKVQAAITAQTMIIKYVPKIIINTGVAGGLTETLAAGNVVIASSLVQHDIDNSGVGDPLGFLPGIGINIPCTEYLVNRFNALAKNINEYDYYVGTIATGDQFIVDSSKVLWIREKFDALACEQEGGSIAQVCYINDIDFCVIRAISDNANGDSHHDYFEFVQRAAARSAELIKNYIQVYANL